MKELFNSTEGSAEVGNYIFQMVLMVGLVQRESYSPDPTAAAKALSPLTGTEKIQSRVF